MDLYTKTTLGCSQLITEHYSTSFTLGIKTLHRRFHQPVYAIYGYVRYADEIVDTFHEHDKATLLRRFKEDTYRAMDERISLNPVIHAFQVVVNAYGIERDLIEAFLYSMEMDLQAAAYDQKKYEKYIYGSAEVVGLMCLRIFCEGDEQLYAELKPAAQKLGAAFQKVNFLRDIKSDFQERGRVYFPGVDFTCFDEKSKKRIEEDIAMDFFDGLAGIKRLPRGARAGVYLAYVYYTRLFQKIKDLPPARILTTRIRVPDAQKMLLLTKTILLYRLNSL